MKLFTTGMGATRDRAAALRDAGLFSVVGEHRPSGRGHERPRARLPRRVAGGARRDRRRFSRPGACTSASRRSLQVRDRRARGIDRLLAFAADARRSRALAQRGEARRGVAVARGLVLTEEERRSWRITRTVERDAARGAARRHAQLPRAFRGRRAVRLQRGAEDGVRGSVRRGLSMRVHAVLAREPARAPAAEIVADMATAIPVGRPVLHEPELAPGRDAVGRPAANGHAAPRGARRAGRFRRPSAFNDATSDEAADAVPLATASSPSRSRSRSPPSAWCSSSRRERCRALRLLSRSTLDSGRRRRRGRPVPRAGRRLHVPRGLARVDDVQAAGRARVADRARAREAGERGLFVALMVIQGPSLILAANAVVDGRPRRARALASAAGRAPPKRRQAAAS